MWTELISLVPYITLWWDLCVSGNVPACPQPAGPYCNHSLEAFNTSKQ